MQRTLRWLYYGKRQRDIVLGLTVASSAILATSAWHFQRPLRADSGGSWADSKSWSSKATVISENASPSGQSQKDLDNTSKLHVARSGGTQTPPPQTRGHSPFEAEGDLPDESETSWQELTERVSAVSDSLTGWDFEKLRSKVTNSVVPSWMRVLPEYMHKIQDELSNAPQSLGWECWEEAHDPEINPEIIWDARVRISSDLCREEQNYLQQRRRHTTAGLAKYLGVPESEVHPDDVPVIAMCGSGGGLRALVAGASSALCAQESGLLDCVTYTAGVSGSCWLQTLYHSSIGKHDLTRVIDHLKQRIGVHIAYPPAALSLLSHSPTNKFLLKGIIEKLRGVPDAEFGVVDVYGLLLAARLLVPKGELRVSDRDLKVSNQAESVKNGDVPLPIYTAVRHEIPDHMRGHINPSLSAWHNTKHYDWFQWFEWTPYEFFCEELGCGIPTWSVGRRWNGGETQWRENGFSLPEMRVPLMMGIWGSAFCATLSHYYKEIRPILRAAGLDKLDSLLSGKDDDLAKVHPVDPAVIPNFCLGLRNSLPDTTPESIHHSSHLQLMDAGMSNNLPIYPLLRPGRHVDIVIAFDASADVKNDNWIKVVDGYVRQRGIQGWPMGAGWPSKPSNDGKNAKKGVQTRAEDKNKTEEEDDSSDYSQTDNEDLGYCNVWVGKIQERQEYMDEPPGRRVRSEDDERYLKSPDAGISLIYLPFLPNERVEGVDPMKSDFMSTWNFIYKAKEIDKVVELAKANFEDGRDQTRRTVRAVWERKRDMRLQREEEGKEVQRKYRMRRSGGGAQMDHHFSGN